MKDRFLKDLGIYGLTTLLVRLINFILIPVYARVLTQKEYGTMDLITTITYVTGVFLFLELYQAVARFYAEAEGGDRQSIVSTGFTYYLLVAIPVLGLVALVNDHLALWLFNDPSLGRLIWLAIAAALALALFNYLQTIQRYALESTAYAIANVICVLSTVMTSIWLVVYQNYGLSGVFIGQIVGASVGLVYAIKSNARALISPLKLNLLKKMVFFSAPLTFAAVVLYLMNYIDRWLINDHLGIDAVGIYAVMFRIAAIPMLVMNIVSNSLLPHIYKEYNDPEKVQELGGLYENIWIGGAWMVSVLGLFSHEIIVLMAGFAYEGYIFLFPLILVSGFLLHFSYLFVGLYLQHKTHYSSIMYTGGLLLILVINSILLPIWGLAGSAISSIITTAVILISQWYYSQKAFYFPIRKAMIFNSAIVFFCPLIFVFIFEKIGEPLALHWRMLLFFGISLYFSLIGKKYIVKYFS